METKSPFLTPDFLPHSGSLPVGVPPSGGAGEGVPGLGIRNGEVPQDPSEIPGPSVESKISVERVTLYLVKLHPNYMEKLHGHTL